MSNTNDSGSLILFNNMGALLPGGGVALFEGDDFLLTDWADSVINRQGFSSPAQWASWALACRGLLVQGRFKYLLESLVARHLIGKKEVLIMYKMQSPDVRVDSPYLTIIDMWNMYSGGECNDDIFPTRESRVQIFEREELVALANEIITVSPSDVSIFEQQLFYRQDNPLSVEFLEHWYKCPHNPLCGKTQALIAIHFYEKKNKVTFPGKRKWRQKFFKEIKEKIAILARREPESHGLSRYIALLYGIARDARHKKDQGVMMEEITDTIAEMVIVAINPHSGRSGMYHGNFLMHIYLTDPSIPDAAKKNMINRVQNACREFSLSFLFFVDDVLKDSREE